MIGLLTVRVLLHISIDAHRKVTCAKFKLAILVFKILHCFGIVLSVRRMLDSVRC